MGSDSKKLTMSSLVIEYFVSNPGDFFVQSSTLESVTTPDVGHGRIETRFYQVVATNLIPELADWPGYNIAPAVTVGTEASAHRFVVGATAPVVLFALPQATPAR